MKRLALFIALLLTVGPSVNGCAAITAAAKEEDPNPVRDSWNAKEVATSEIGSLQVVDVVANGEPSLRIRCRSEGRFAQHTPIIRTIRSKWTNIDYLNSFLLVSAEAVIGWLSFGNLFSKTFYGVGFNRQELNDGQQAMVAATNVLATGLVLLADYGLHVWLSQPEQYTTYKVKQLPDREIPDGGGYQGASVVVSLPEVGWQGSGKVGSSGFAFIPLRGFPLNGVTERTLVGTVRPSGSGVAVDGDFRLVLNGKEWDGLLHKIRRHLSPESPLLGVEARFADRTRDGVLEGNESGDIRVAVTNRGKGTAFGVRVSPKRPEMLPMDLGSEVVLGDLRPGERKECVIHVQAQVTMPNSEASIALSVTEDEGFDAAPSVVSFATKSLIPGDLSVVGVHLNDAQTRALDNLPDGAWQIGEVLSLEGSVANSGQGLAKSVTVYSASPDDRVVIEPSAIALADIPPGKSLPFRFTVRPLQGLSTAQMALKLTTEDALKLSKTEYAVPVRFETQDQPDLRVQVSTNPIVLDAESKRSIGVTVVNAGKRRAFAPVLTVSAKELPSLEYRTRYTLSDLPPNMKANYQIPLGAPDILRPEQGSLTLTLSEGNDIISSPIDVGVTLRLMEAAFDLREVVVRDDGSNGISAGNGDGRVQPSEQIELLATVANAGNRDATDVVLELVSTEPETVRVVPGLSRAARLAPGQKLTQSFSFSVNRRYRGARKLPLLLRCQDARGRVNADFPLSVELVDG